MNAYLILVVVVTSPSCSNGDDRSPCNAQVISGEVDLDVVYEHSRGPERFYAISNALLGLLRTRQSMESIEFDPAIRELAKMLCVGTTPNIQQRIIAEPIERLYPVDRIGECVELGCGWCRLAGREDLIGAAFPEGIPDLDARAIREKVHTRSLRSPPTR